MGIPKVDKRRSNSNIKVCMPCSRELKNIARTKVRVANKKFLRKITDNTCTYCGYHNDSSAPFDWHHLDPTEKEGTIGNLISIKNRDKLLNEIDKCEFICKNCHALEHEKLRKENK